MVLVACAVGSCTADKGNPVLPSTGNTNGWVASGSYDAQMDVTPDGAADAYADLSNGDSAPGSCDLLTQQGCAPDEACYPTSDVGKCQRTDGTAGALASCVDPTACGRGFACVPLTDMGATCVEICDVYHPQAACGIGVACHPRWVGMTVGYCEPA
jgi:hypothetical protein